MKDIEQILDDNCCDINDFSNTIEFCEYRDALLGFTEDYRFVYDYDAIVKILMDRDGMTSDEAMEYVDYNVVGFHISGANAPIIIQRLYI